MKQITLDIYNTNSIGEVIKSLPTKGGPNWFAAEFYPDVQGKSSINITEIIPHKRKSMKASKLSKKLMLHGYKILVKAQHQQKVN